MTNFKTQTFYDGRSLNCVHLNHQIVDFNFKIKITELLGGEKTDQ